MKKLSLLGLGAAVLLSACLKEPKPEPVGEAKIRYVNTVIGSNPQEFYVNGAKKSLSALPYGSYSSYYTITSGSNVFILADEGATTGNSGTDATISIGDYGTVYYARALNNNLAAAIYRDDNTAPAAGKARVRFLHFNHLLKNSLNVNLVGETTTTPIATNIPFGEPQDYKTVDPGAKFTFTGTGVTTSPVLDAGIVAGRNYTVWINGATATELIGHIMLQENL